MGRLLPAGTVVRDQLDFYSPPNSTVRVPGVMVGTLDVKIFLNGSILPWTAVDGTSIPDSALSAGTILFNEILGAPGFYSSRFFPDRVGYWRLVVYQSSSGNEQIRDYDIVPAGTFSPSSQGGVTASFTK